MIIDFHTHIFPDSIADRTISSLSSIGNIPSYSNGKISGLIDSMEKAHIDISVNLPALTRATQFDSVLNFARDINNQYENVISFAGFHPQIEDFEEKLNKIKECGFLGIKLHPDYQGTFFDDEKYVNIMKCAKELDLVTVTHAGFDVAFEGQEIKCTPKRVLNLLYRLGGYEKLVLAHMGGNELFKEVCESLAGENIYFDTSYVLKSMGQDMFTKILEKHGEDKILFATDSPWQSQEEMVNALLSYGLENDTKEKIFYKNAKKLLNLR